MRAALVARLTRALVATLAALPLSAARRVGALAGLAAWYGGARAAATTRTNIALCFADRSAAARRALARRSVLESGRLLGETGMVWRWDAARLDRVLLEVNGAEPLDRGARGGRGCLVLLPHYGNWELMGYVLGRRSQISALYDPPKVAGLEGLVTQARERWGARMHPPTIGGLRALYAALRRGEVLALLPDQVPAYEGGVHAPFFGQPALTMTLVHRILRRTDPIVLIGAARRTVRAGRAGFVVEFREVDDAIRDPDPVVSATAMNRAIEKLVSVDPAQYQWEYKRFRRGPAGARLY